MWIDTRDCVPLVDGEYMVQTVYGRVEPLSYTPKGGWNTHYDAITGELRSANAIEDLYVVRWCDIEKPEAVPQERLNEYRVSKGVIK